MFEDDIVPSSNPDSPLLDYQTKLSIQSELKHKDPCEIPSSIEGHPVKVQEDDLHCHCKGREYARFMLENLVDVTSDSRQHQTCNDMCKQLVPITIKDPFANLPPEQTAEDLRLGTNEHKDITTEPFAELELMKDLEKLPDAWKDKQQNNEELLLPELVSMAHIEYNHPSMCDVMPDYCLRLEEDSYTKQFDWSETEFLGLDSTSTRSHPEQLPCISQTDGDPIKLNSEGLGPSEDVESSDVQKRSLESPQTPIDVSTTSENPGQDNEKLPITPISCFDTEIVTPKTKEKTEKRIWKTEQYLHEAVALSLKVPEVKNMDKPNPLLSPKSELGLTKEHGNTDVDLLLPWQLVNISKVMKNKKFTMTIEGLEGADEIKMLDSKVDSCQEPVVKEDLSIDDDESDIMLDPLEVETKQPSKECSSSDSDEQTENSEEHMNTTSDTSVTENEKPLAEESKEKKEDAAPKRCSPIGDPLMDFLKLRCKESLIRKDPPPLPPPLLPRADQSSKELQLKSTNDAKTVSKPVVIKKEILDHDDSKESELTPTKSGNKKSKSRTVEVTLTAPFVEMMKVLEDALTPVMNRLHSTNVLSPSYTLHTLTPDVSRFLLLQYEKQSKSTDKEDTEEYQQIVLLHSYVTAIDLMIHCDAVSAIMHLALANERYKDILKGCLDGVRNTLFKKHCMLPKHTLHPKLHEMVRLTGEWFLKKLKKEGKDHDPKVLVIIRREYAKLAESVTTVLLSVRGLSASTLSSTYKTIYMAVSQALDKHNCLVISPAQIDESFPWAHFSLVIEYEAYPNSPWKELCLRQNIRHIELRCTSSVGVGADLGRLSLTDDNVRWPHGLKFEMATFQQLIAD
ncbi:protein shortage in chiasmata 1 ortholog-like [Lytechinus variegatus]|uniref:protein shortage in chiasmata 1 ortholog-like n=1 Tax=Lytechinus variegatus TaxID=7654 RepID=UPI001BB22B5F|nr:protein shortage in chiasmata 1 ortholog-like [Lytechinus variegatus]